ncbi:MAG TPA: hypothetical protein VE959_21890 [Bryobacteraceae bacterium]|nr:hypothetical protein [Bryobacteraceae bacterium]
MTGTRTATSQLGVRQGLGEMRLIGADRQHGLAVLEGLAMLVYQGVIGFELWK